MKTIKELVENLHLRLGDENRTIINCKKAVVYDLQLTRASNRAELLREILHDIGPVSIDWVEPSLMEEKEQC